MTNKDKYIVLLRVFLDGEEIPFRDGLKLEKAGEARVSDRGTETVPDRLGGGAGPWVELSRI